MTSLPEEQADGTLLTGVSETALLTLRSRANEAKRRDSIIADPMAIRLVDAIGADYSKFGRFDSQGMALRALAFDGATRNYLNDHPAATVVALAEGLETSFWRLDAAIPDAQFRWLTVDFPPIVTLRAQLLPDSSRIDVAAQSALDYSWMDHVDDGDGVFITAEGLLMYLQPEQSLSLIAECAKRFPGGRMLFDLPPAWFAAWARKGMRTSLRYRVPKMPFSLSVSEAADLANTVPGVRGVHDLSMPQGRGQLFNFLLSTTYRIPLLDNVRPPLTLLDFG